MTSVKLALFILFRLATMSSVAAYACGPCSCHDGDIKHWADLIVADCWKKTSLTTVPDTSFPANLQVLHIHGGSISKIKNSQFTSYRGLEQIIINRNKIELIIEQGAFRYLTKVTHINLNNNQITEVPTDCFTLSSNLFNVDLQANKIKRLQTHLFSNLKYLKAVYLNNNDITTVEEHCFVNVPQLEEIRLHNNNLIFLDIKFLDKPSHLKILYLQDNPWHCNTSLCGVLDTVVNHELWGVSSAPTCTTPQRRLWSKSLLTELCSYLPSNGTNIPPEPQPTCEAPLIITNTTSVSEGQDLLLTCKYCFPSRLVWTFNDAKLPSNYVQKSELSLTSTLTIPNVVRGQQGYYLCRIRGCEDCEDVGVYVSVTGKPQSDVDIKQVVHVPGVNSSESCGSRRGLLLLQYTVVPATELNTTLSDKN